MSRSQKYPVQILLICLLCSQLQGYSIDPVIKEKIDNFILNEFLPSNRDPAFSMAVTNGNGSLLYSQGFGMMDVEEQIPTTNETLFFMGSISKSFAGVLVAKTLNEKFPQLEKVMDTPVSKLAPDFNITLNDRFRSEQVSFRDMLSHRVCSISDGTASTVFIPFRSIEEVSYRQRYAPEECGFRTAMIYNNAMYAVITKAIEHIAGRPYEDILTDFFADLGMTSSTYLKERDDDIIPGRAIPYYWKDNGRHRFNPKLLRSVVLSPAAGGIISTPLDMAKYIQFHLNKGKVGETQVVPENVMDWLYQPAVVLPAEENRYEPGRAEIEIGYGLGIRTASTDGWLKIWHSGSVPPFVSWMSFYPGLNIGIISSSNQQPLNATLDHPHFHNAVLDILSGKEVRKSIPQQTEDSVKQQEVKKYLKAKTPRKFRSIPLLNYTGNYGSGLYGELEISLRIRNETNLPELFMDYGTWGQAFMVETQDELVFQLEWVSDVVHIMYALSLDERATYTVFTEDQSRLQVTYTGLVFGIFDKDVRLDILPPIPWLPGSCGPQTRRFQ